MVSNSRDITETRLIQDQLSHDATHDTLTGLANRALFADRAGRSVADPRPEYRFSVAIVDLDDFKTVNDTLGHHVGDGLLGAVAERMRAMYEAQERGEGGHQRYVSGMESRWAERGRHYAERRALAEEQGR